MQSGLSFSTKAFTKHFFFGLCTISLKLCPFMQNTSLTVSNDRPPSPMMNE